MFFSPLLGSHKLISLQHASPEEKASNQLDYPDCSDFDDLNLAIYTDEDQENYYKSYVAWD